MPSSEQRNIANPGAASEAQAPRLPPRNDSETDAQNGSEPQSVERLTAGGPPLPPSIVDRNVFRLRKRFDCDTSPEHDPDNVLSASDRYDSTHHESLDSEDENDSDGESDMLSFEPFPNLSSFELGEWFYGQGTQKSIKDFKALVKILTSPDFSLDDIKDTKWTRVFQDLGKNKEELNPRKSGWVDDSGWKATDIEIEVPIHNRMQHGRGVEKHVAGKLFHRSIVSIVEEKIRNAEDSQLFHYAGHELLWKPDPSDSSPEFRVMSELYHSDAFLKAQREVKQATPESIKDCVLPRVVVGLMFWSDATHVSTFSTSKLWPLYMLFANESKYRRTKGGSDLCNHVAYFDALSDSFKDYITGRTGGKVPPNLMAHLNRDYAHAQWEILLDEELLKAIVEGLVIECCDGKWRRFFIRIFTYSTDYPERVLMATIKARGDCPCVRCLVRKKDLNQTGASDDIAFREANPRVESQARQDSVLKARDAIQKGLAVGGDKVVCFLSNSNVPTVNAFSKRLGKTGFDIFAALAVDILHEFEIGVFKALFIHLIRILDALASGSTLIHELDRRYRSMPTFNQTIRKFSANASGLKRRAARDYEDLLQCAIPVFDGLFTGSLNDLVLKLLYLNARWHALAKLRMQNEATIVLIEEVTTQLGDQYRQFVKDTSKINTIERQSETDKRTKAANKKQGSQKKGSSQQPPDGSANVSGASTTTTIRPIQRSPSLVASIPITEQSNAGMNVSSEARNPQSLAHAQGVCNGAPSFHASDPSVPSHCVMLGGSSLGCVPSGGSTPVPPQAPYTQLRGGSVERSLPASTVHGRANDFASHQIPFTNGFYSHSTPEHAARSHLLRPPDAPSQYPQQNHLPQNYLLQPSPAPVAHTMQYYPPQARQIWPSAPYNAYPYQTYPLPVHRSSQAMTHDAPSQNYQSMSRSWMPDFSHQSSGLLPQRSTSVCSDGRQYTFPVSTLASQSAHTVGETPLPVVSQNRDGLSQALQAASRAQAYGHSLPAGQFIPRPLDPAHLNGEHYPIQYGLQVPLSTAHSPSTPLTNRPASQLVDSAAQACDEPRTALPSSSSHSTESVDPASAATDTPAATTTKASNGRRPKKMNLHTVKFHALGHYPSVIRQLGPTDLYSTEWVRSLPPPLSTPPDTKHIYQGEFFHKSPKAWTKQTSRRQLRMELSRHERRRKRIQRTKYRIMSTGKTAKSQEFIEQRTAARNPDIHHFIGMSTRIYVSLSDFSQGGRFAKDIASSMFVRNLKQYLLPRFVSAVLPHLEGSHLENFIQKQDWSRLVLKKDRIYTHQIMRIKYTTYDTRRDEDIIHLDTAQCNVMLLNHQYSRSTPMQHPFRYGKVIAICHVDVGYVGDMGCNDSRFTHHRAEFLWVRWYRVHPASTAFQLDQAELLSPDEPGSHSFIDPLEVLRACHMMPCYREAKLYADGKGKSELAQDGSDWKKYYINRFVDRDMFMRYEWGLAVGHTYTHTDSVSAIQSVLQRKTTADDNFHGPTSTARDSEHSRSEAALETSPSDTVGGVRPQRTPTIRSDEGSTGALVLTLFPPDTPELLGGSAQIDPSAPQQDTIGEFDYGMDTWRDNDLEALRDRGEEEENEFIGSDDGSIETDATSVRGYSDEEEERLISLFGRD